MRSTSWSSCRHRPKFASRAFESVNSGFVVKSTRPSLSGRRSTTSVTCRAVASPDTSHGSDRERAQFSDYQVPMTWKHCELPCLRQPVQAIRRWPRRQNDDWVTKRCRLQSSSLTLGSLRLNAGR